jgi:hypothetical protein
LRGEPKEMLMATKSTHSSARAKKPATARLTRAPAKPSAKPARKRPTPKRKPLPSSDGMSKQSQLITLLQSPTGGTVEQMMSLTGWQPHSVRGVISGVLRKRLGLTVSSEVQESGSRVYRIVGAAA